MQIENFKNMAELNQKLKGIKKNWVRLEKTFFLVPETGNVIKVGYHWNAKNKKDIWYYFKVILDKSRFTQEYNLFKGISKKSELLDLISKELKKVSILLSEKNYKTLIDFSLDNEEESEGNDLDSQEYKLDQILNENKNFSTEFDRVLAENRDKILRKYNLKFTALKSEPVLERGLWGESRIEIELNNILLFPIEQWDFISLVPNHFLPILFNITLRKIVTEELDNGEILRIVLISRGVVLSEKLDLFRLKLKQLYKKTNNVWFKNKMEDIRKYQANPYFNLGDSYEDQKQFFEDSLSKSYCKKCFAGKEKDSEQILTFVLENPVVSLKIKSGGATMISEKNIIDYGSIMWVLCFNCNHPYLAEEKFKEMESSFFKEKIELFDSKTYDCYQCGWNSWNEFISEEEKKVNFKFWALKLVKIFDYYGKVKKIFVNEYGNIISMHCPTCNHIIQINS